eukprot:CAMPEP_0206430098 /NCGR_PEP_ID=MMETSP0324_2-20121206/6621_1 /ASSEMBLY_ACC=CAM_ASM_000836 /TAXON_ID=2866 /ORGANISM="Crypthecodinium cohnii, Strain Seligo" /LENGTH=78 /DNA_ID=CAMNT_0053895879 /DNA_START=41 /DNA_END=274 /DNA_ORIENTATION=-
MTDPEQQIANSTSTDAKPDHLRICGLRSVPICSGAERQEPESPPTSFKTEGRVANTSSRWILGFEMPAILLVWGGSAA